MYKESFSPLLKGTAKQILGLGKGVGKGIGSTAKAFRKLPKVVQHGTIAAGASVPFYAASQMARDRLVPTHVGSNVVAPMEPELARKYVTKLSCQRFIKQAKEYLENSDA